MNYHSWLYYCVQAYENRSVHSSDLNTVEPLYGVLYEVPLYTHNTYRLSTMSGYDVNNIMRLHSLHVVAIYRNYFRITLDSLSVFNPFIMPLVQRAIEPYFTSRKELDKSVKNELEGVVANTLGELIRQLSSLSKHAENLFGELLKDANAIFDRSNKLNTRIEVLVDRVTKLDPVVEQGNVEYKISIVNYKLQEQSISISM